MRLPAAFHRLQWKLTTTYTLVTVLWIVALEITLITTLGIAFFRSGYLPGRLADSLVKESAAIRSAVILIPPNRTEITQWIDKLTQRGEWMVDEELLNYYADTHQPDEFLLIVVDEAGQVLGTNQPSAQVPTLSSQAARLLQTALEGATGTTALSGPDGGGAMIAVAPILTDTGQPRGAVLIRVTTVPGLAKYLGTSLFVLIPSVLIFMALASGMGLLFGFIAARGLTQRLARLTQASEAWSRGDFSAYVADASSDEVGLLARRLNQMAEQLQSLLASRQVLATLEERNRIARDLHDSAKQQAFALAAQLGAARSLLKRDLQTAEACLRESEYLADDLRQELANLILELRPPALKDKGLATALRDYVADWSRHSHMATDVHVQGERALPLELEQTLFRIAQEALANVARHSHAHHVGLQLDYANDSVTLAIADDGQGFDSGILRNGVGLHSMRERVESLKGTLIIESAPGRGTRVIARVN